MNETLLHLKDGQSHALCVPTGSEIQDILHCMRVPADAAGRTLRLRVPDGSAIDIAAADIASLEVPASYALVPDFMTDTELEQVWAYTLAHADAFQSSHVYEAPNQAKDDVPRRSRILGECANTPMAAIVGPKLQALLPKLWPQLRMNPLPLDTLEFQVTAHGDGDFFASHTDNGVPEAARRLISYVHYFHREPKQFSGGHLRLYHLLFQDGYLRRGRLAADIDPPRNSVVIFPTFLWHEVTPIRCASSALADQRLTLNGWLS